MHEAAAEAPRRVVTAEVAAARALGLARMLEHAARLREERAAEKARVSGVAAAQAEAKAVTLGPKVLASGWGR